jgi:hypothetical protein
MHRKSNALRKSQILQYLSFRNRLAWAVQRYWVGGTYDRPSLCEAV